MHLENQPVERQPSNLRVRSEGTGGVIRQKSKQEKLVLLKQDIAIAFILSGCFFFSYLDRSSLGNARIMGLQADLGLTDAQFMNCLMMFFVGYMVFELPAALSLRIFQPPHVYGIAIALFGVFACCLSVSRTYAAVMVLRLLIGIGEAVVQTGFVYLSLWYLKDELATRYAVFYFSAPLAGGINGILAYGIDKNLNNVSGKAAWEWLFLIEGVCSVFWGVIVFFILPRLPERVAEKGSLLFRREEEQAIILQRTIEARNDPDAKFQAFQIWWALKDPKTWLDAVVVAAPCLDVAAFGNFLPTFVNQFGFSKLNAQLFTLIPYSVAMLTLPLFSLASDRARKKAIPTLLCLTVSVIGFVILLCDVQRSVLIVGCCLVAAGSYPAIVLAASWLLVNHAGYTKRSTAWAVAQIFIQCYSIISTQVYIHPPRFIMGHAVLLALNALGVVAGLLKYYIMKRENARRDRLAQQVIGEALESKEEEKSIEQLCDYHPDFRYSF
ncbi:major facilitator superfamily domain-containing protein [Talaromyces proteolyticus]|uniref:Major facilitator superfamily domain-containing protein n=1 Tax=Talaromyces proteolyticus TaxID=1131652 RepID=A0AAD4PX25_9EURO|nr:major facilitator superfamily domain-containing protein [Talaromyces proteolyticus]KAH8698862.1 major facilitator superfamily domain-containing protein [Talaromyces proteolyticus]